MSSVLVTNPGVEVVETSREPGVRVGVVGGVLGWSDKQVLDAYVVWWLKNAG